jgi:hypothetical protein
MILQYHLKSSAEPGGDKKERRERGYLGSHELSHCPDTSIKTEHTATTTY